MFKLIVLNILFISFSSTILSTPKPTNLEELPCEVLGHISDFLGNSDIDRLGQVSTRLNTFVKSNQSSGRVIPGKMAFKIALEVEGKKAYEEVFSSKNLEAIPLLKVMLEVCPRYGVDLKKLPLHTRNNPNPQLVKIAGNNRRALEKLQYGMGVDSLGRVYFSFIPLTRGNTFDRRSSFKAQMVGRPDYYRGHNLIKLSERNKRNSDWMLRNVENRLPDTFLYFPGGEGEIKEGIRRNEIGLSLGRNYSSPLFESLFTAPRVNSSEELLVGPKSLAKNLISPNKKRRLERDKAEWICGVFLKNRTPVRLFGRII